MIQADGASANLSMQFPWGILRYSRRENNDNSSPGVGGAGDKELEKQTRILGPR